MSATRTELATIKESSARSEGESLTGLIARLGEDVVQLVDTKLSLLKVELSEEAHAYARHGITLLVAGVISAVGFALLNVAIAFAVSSLFSSSNISQAAKYALGFVITGVFYLLVGGIAVAVVKSRLATQNLVPNRTVEELRKDKQWLKNEL